MDYNYHYFNDLLENVNVNLYCHLKRNKIHQKER